jgi:phosphatidylserine decarboxylase
MNVLKARLFLLLQYLLPRYGLTALIYRVARIRQRAIKDFLIRGFIRLFKVDTSEIKAQLPDDFEHFNAFFIRELEDDARPIADASNALVSPVDGTVSEAGTITHGRLLQAKGRYYSLRDLLATDLGDAATYDGGQFATIYLAPYNYHRVHAPLAGRLRAARYVPGDLFSVNHTTARQLAGLFARNERLVCHFESDHGPFAVIFVGALNVGSISTPWSGEIRPRKSGVVEEIDLSHSGASVDVQKGELLGWFNMGSTVILLMPRASCELRPGLGQGTTVRMGERLATLKTLAP